MLFQLSPVMFILQKASTENTFTKFLKRDLSMRIIKKILCIAILFSLIAGCVATQNIPVEMRKRVFNADEQAVFDAALAYLVTAGYQIDVAEKETGIITTGYNKSGRWERGDQTRLTALIRSLSPGRTGLILTLTIEKSDSTGSFSNTYFRKSKAQKLYRKHFRGIHRQLPTI